MLDLPKDVYDANTQPMLSHINVGSGTDVSILELARIIANRTGRIPKALRDTDGPIHDQQGRDHEAGDHEGNS